MLRAVTVVTVGCQAYSRRPTLLCLHFVRSSEFRGVGASTLDTLYFSSFQFFRQRVHYPFFIRELAGLEFGVDQFTVEGDLETPASRRDQLEVLDLLLVGGEELARQTDGLGFVVSHRAVFEFHVHDHPSEKV